MAQQPQVIAVASVEGSTWTWDLKVDDSGLFRWYLNGTVETNLRGVNKAHAESMLCRFVNSCLLGDLKIGRSGRIGQGSETRSQGPRSASVG